MAESAPNSNAGAQDVELGRPPELDSDEYNRLIACAELDDIRLVKSSFSIEPDYFDGGIADEKHFKIDYNMGDPAFNGGIKKLFTSFEYAVHVLHGEACLLSCAATYLVVFSIEGEFDEGLLKYFGRRIGRNASYPYFREHVSAQSWVSGAHLPILPVMKTDAARKKAAEVSGSEI